MPVVKAYPGRQIKQDALPGARLNVDRDPNAFGAGFGATVTRVAGAELDEIAARRREQMIAERKRMDEIAVIHASNQLDAFENDLLYGDSGLMRTKGNDSFGAYDGFEKAYTTKGDELEKGLANEEQKLAFLRRRSSKFDSASSKLRQHIASESEKFDAAESQKQIENITNDAVRSYTSPREVAAKLGEAEMAARAYADRNGMGAEQTKAMVLDVKSGIHQGVINNLLADPEKAPAAQVYFDAVKDQIDPKKLDEIEKALHVGSIRGQSQKEADRILQESKTLTEALEKAKTIENPELRDDTEDRIQREFNRRKAAEQADNETRMTEAGNILDKTNGNIRAISPAEWSKLSPGQKQQLQNYAKREVTGGGSGTGTSGMALWMKLMEEKASDPEAFKRRDLTKFIGTINKTELKSLMNEQVDLRAGKQVKELDDFRTVNQVIEGALDGIIDTTKDKAAKGKVTQAVAEKQRDFIRRTGKQPLNEDIAKMVDEVVREEVTIKGSQVWDFNPFNNSDTRKPVLQLKPKDIPASERRRIEAKLRSLSIPVNDREVMRFFVDENRVR